MKISIGLDLSTVNSGYSVFHDDKLIKYGSIKPKTTLDVLQRIEVMCEEFRPIIKEQCDKHNVFEDEIIFVVENIFLGFFKGRNQVLGFANLGRISGAVMAIIFNNGQPAENIILRNANVARPMVGLSGSCQKCEVQSWVINKFFNIDNSDYEGLIDAVYAQKNVGDISQEVYKKRMGDISKLIESETGFGEDVSDAILLSYSEVKHSE